MTTFTLPIFNNKFTNKKENPRILSKKLQKNNLGRQNDCNTPFRNPYNHWRKTSTCGDTCKTNVKVLKDNVAINFDKPTCYNPYIRNILNKNGIRKNEFVFSKSLLNYKQHKTFQQNTASNIYTTVDISNNNKYRNTPTDTQGIRKDIVASGNTVNKNPDIKCNATVLKYANRGFRKQGAVSGRNRIARLKYNTVLQASYKNAVNGDLIGIQGVSHHGVPPFRNNKNVDSFDNPKCSSAVSNLRNTKLSCNFVTKNKTASKKEKEYYFSKTYEPPKYFTHNNIYNMNINSNTTTTSTTSGSTTSGSTTSGSTTSGSTTSGSTTSGSTTSGSTTSGSTTSGSTTSGSTTSGSTSYGY